MKPGFSGYRVWMNFSAEGEGAVGEQNDVHEMDSWGRMGILD